MRILRAAVFAIVAIVVLLGTTSSRANASPLDCDAALPDDTTSASTDPGDPGFPPGD